MKYTFVALLFFSVSALMGQDKGGVYTKKVLEKVSVQTLFSYYAQDGQNAAVTGGEGTEALTNAAPTMVVQIPLGKMTTTTMINMKTMKINLLEAPNRCLM